MPAHHCALVACDVASVGPIARRVGTGRSELSGAHSSLCQIARLAGHLGVTALLKLLIHPASRHPINAEWLAKYTQLHKNKNRVDSLDQYCVAGVPRLTARHIPS